tara:strand:+ start:11436 stop:12068 length:633 start_codon:yes stop_codon:yes gene_type:complete
MSFNYLEKKAFKSSDRLLVILHGYGANEYDLFQLSDAFVHNSHVVSVQAPYKLSPESYAWYAIHFDEIKGKWSDINQAKEIIEKLHVFLQALKKQYQVDYLDLLGFSQGAILSYALATKYPKNYSKIMALSGYFNKQLNEISKENSFSYLKIYASHGAEDSVIPLSWSAEILNLLDELDIDHEYQVFQGMGHTINQENLNALMHWYYQFE